MEFGFNHDELTGGSGANVAGLVIERGWDHLLFDGGHENLEINLHRHFLTSENIVSLFSRYSVPEEPEYISIDVDSIDLWLFRAVVKKYRAMIFSVEYNSNFPLNKAITTPNDVDFRWNGDRAYGASLRALNMVAESQGYSLLWVVPGLDLFFIRNDLIDDGSGNIVPPIEHWKKETCLPNHKPVRDDAKLRTFIDYEDYVSKPGPRSTGSGFETARRYLGATKYDRFQPILKLVWGTILPMVSILPNPIKTKVRSFGHHINYRLRTLFT